MIISRSFGRENFTVVWLHAYRLFARVLAQFYYLFFNFIFCYLLFYLALHLTRSNFFPAKCARQDGSRGSRRNRALSLSLCRRGINISRNRFIRQDIHARWKKKNLRSREHWLSRWQADTKPKRWRCTTHGFRYCSSYIVVFIYIFTYIVLYGYIILHIWYVFW